MIGGAVGRTSAMAVVAVLALVVGTPVLGQSEEPAVSEPRVIDLEMAGVGRFLRDGEEVRELHVIPGETVMFRVDNTAGQELAFAVGSHDAICDRSQTPRKAIPAWTEGIRELAWTVPAGAAHRRWGHRGRYRGRYCQLGTFTVGGEPSHDRTPPPPRDRAHLRAHLAYSESWISFDADFEGTTSVVAWLDWADPWRTLHVSRSDDVSLDDWTTLAVADDIDDRSIAVCGADVVVAYLQRAPDADRRLEVARVPDYGSARSSVEVRTPIERLGSIDVTCTADRAYVAWTELVDGDWQARVSTVSLPDLSPSAVHTAGPARRYRIAVAATDDHALLAWQEGTRIRLRRFRADPVDGQLVPLSTRTVAKRGKRPILDADGARVAIAYDRGNLGHILTSRDGGVTFDRRTRFDRGSVGGAPREVDSLAIRGRDVVATMVVYYGGDAWDRQRLRSHDRGTSWTTSRIGNPGAAIPRDGFLETPKGVKVAEAYTDGVYASKSNLRVRREE